MGNFLKIMLFIVFSLTKFCHFTIISPNYEFFTVQPDEFVYLKIIDYYMQIFKVNCLSSPIGYTTTFT